MRLGGIFGGLFSTEQKLKAEPMAALDEVSQDLGAAELRTSLGT